MRQRIREALDQGFVQGDVFAHDFELNFLSQRTGQVPHHAGEFGEHIADGLKARLHDHILEFGCDLVDALVHGGQELAVILRHRGAELVAAEHKLAGQVHQGLQQ